MQAEVNRVANSLVLFMTRTELINCFIRHRRFQSYLEIGVGIDRENFDRIQCEHKQGIDASYCGEGIQQLDSDAFFRESADTFDVIFIDGMHEEAQVDRDIANSISRLNTGGVVILHDCLPPDEWYQRPACDYRVGEAWNGTVWKSVLKCFATSEFRCYVVDLDWGCGVIDTGRHGTSNPRCGLPPALDYRRDFCRLADYVLSEGRFLTELYDVAAFYHIAAIGNWEAVIEEHFDLLRTAEINLVRFSYVGCPDGLDVVSRAAEKAGIQALLVGYNSELTAYESPAMKMIEDWARTAPESGSILYFHTKGVSLSWDPIRLLWRKLMNHEVLVNWRQLVPQLDSYDAIGVNWRNWPPIAHFCGNFWWARVDWVRTLAPFDEYYHNPRYSPTLEDSPRLGCEFWIGSGPGTPRILSLVCADQDFTQPDFWSHFSHPALVSPTSSC